MVTGDQFELLARGWLMVQEGTWIHYGSPTSTGGFNPGSLTSLLVAVPLYVVMDHRAPIVLIVILHIVAFLILDRTMSEALSPRARLLFAVLYWLNPGRVYFSGFLWNPNYLPVLGALHLFTAWRQRDEPSAAFSFLHVLAAGLAFQIHASFLLLIAATVALVMGRMFRLHIGGALAGAAASAVLLTPWILAVAEDPSILPGSSGFLGRGLVLVYPVLRGILYWLRYGSLDVSSKLLDFDFSLAVGAAGDRVLTPIMIVIARAAGVITTLVALVANIRLWGGRGTASDAEAHIWIARYARRCFVAALVVYALSPTTVMYWQGVLLLHAAVIPVALFVDGQMSSRPGAVRLAIPAWCFLAAILVAAMAFGSNQFRCNGRESINGGRRNDHPMLHQLGVHRDCRVEIYPSADPLPSVLDLR